MAGCAVSGELAVSITRADGSVKRWGAGEPDAADVPGDLSFSTSIPGGFKDSTCSLFRRVDLEYSDQGLFDHVRVYGAGNQTAWEGRMVQFPRDHGDSFGIQPAAVGHAAHLKDDPSFREIYVDRDLSHWSEWSLARQSTYITAGYNIVTWSPSVARNDSASSGIIFTATGAMPKSAREHYYDGQAIPVARLYCALGYRGGISSASTELSIKPRSTSDDNATGEISASEQKANSTIDFSPATAQSFMKLNVEWSTSGGAAGTSYSVDFTNIAVYGNHGLTVRGSAPEGFYASDVIADIVGRAAPLLTYSTGTDGSIEPTTFVIPHLAFLSPGTAEDAIATVNAYHLYDWGVYDDAEFFYREPDPDRLTWEARLSEGAKLSLEGDTAEQAINGVFVTYPDASGVTKTVGPPGALANATDSTLADTSDTNPVNAHNIPRRWARLDLSLTTTQAGAIQLGYAYLQERLLASRRGQITLTGTVTHPTEGKVPVWRIRAGDWIKISDHPASAPRKIIETSYSHGTRSITLSVDNTVGKVEAILERLGLFSIGRF